MMENDDKDIKKIMKMSAADSFPSHFTDKTGRRILPKAVRTRTGLLFYRSKDVRKKTASANMHGFTMIEVITALLVIGILSAFAVSRYSSTAPYSLKSQIDVIKIHLRFAQTRAMNSNDYWGINFAGSSYTFFSSADPSTPVMLPGEDSAVVAIPFGITTTTGIVVFDTWGKPYTDAAGASIQTGDRNIVVSLAGEPSETITITENTGFVP